MTDESKQPTHMWIGGRQYPLAKEISPDLSEGEELAWGADAIEDLRSGYEPEPRENYRSPAAEERENWSSERDAYDKLINRAEEVRDQEQQDATNAEEHRRTARRKAVQEAATWSKEEKAALDQLDARAQKFRSDEAMFMAAHRAAAANPEQVTPAQRQELAAFAQQLQAEQAFLQGAAQKLPGAIRAKESTVLQTEVFGEVPALKDEAAREELIRWAVDKGFCTESQARANRDPGLVKQAWTAMQKEKAEAAKARKKAQVADWAKHHYPGTRVGGTPQSSAEARERLVKTGSIFDALAALEMDKRERRG